jgi:hypothetical protein
VEKVVECGDGKRTEGLSQQRTGAGERPIWNRSTVEKSETNVENSGTSISSASHLDTDGTPTGDPVYGHKYGHKNWREIERAEAQGLSQKGSNDRMNNPDLYQIEGKLKMRITPAKCRGKANEPYHQSDLST